MSTRNLLASPKTSKSKRASLVSAGLTTASESSSNNSNRQKGEVDILHFPDSFVRKQLVVDAHYLLFLYCNVESSIASELKKSMSQPKIIETLVFAEEKDDMKIREISLPDPYDNIVLENLLPETTSIASSNSNSHTRGKSGSLGSNASETRILKKYCLPISFQVSSLVQKFMKKKALTEFSIRYDLCIVNPFKSETSTSTASKTSQTTDSVIVSVLASKTISNLHLLASNKDYEKICAKSHQNHQELVSTNKDFLDLLTQQRSKLDRLNIAETELENMKRKHQLKLDRILKSAKDNEEQMKSQLIAFDKEIFDLKQKETELLSSISQYQKEVESLCKKMDELGSFYSQELERSKDLENKLEKSQAFKTQNQELVKKNEEYIAQVQSLQQNVDTLQTQVQQVSSELEQEKQKNTSTLKQLQTDETKQTQLEKQVTELAEKNSLLSKQSQNSQELINQLQAKLQDEQKKNTELQKQNNELLEQHQQVLNLTSKFKTNSIASSPSRRPSLNLLNLKSPTDSTNSTSPEVENISPERSLTARGRLNSYVAQVKEMYEQHNIQPSAPVSSRQVSKQNS